MVPDARQEWRRAVFDRPLDDHDELMTALALVDEDRPSWLFEPGRELRDPSELFLGQALEQRNGGEVRVENVVPCVAAVPRDLHWHPGHCQCGRRGTFSSASARIGSIPRRSPSPKAHRGYATEHGRRHCVGRSPEPSKRRVPFCPESAQRGRLGVARRGLHAYACQRSETTRPTSSGWLSVRGGDELRLPVTSAASAALRRCAFAWRKAQLGSIPRRARPM
jgi:hypothetical protein